MRDSVMMYVTQCDALRDLPPEQFKAAVIAIWDYAMKEIEPNADPVTMMAWKLCKPLIDRNNRNYVNSKRTASEPQATTERTGSDIEATTERTTSEPGAVAELKVKGKRLKDKDIEREKESVRFHPPTPEEVREYVETKGYRVDPTRFCDFYASKGWKVGSSPMKDWKAAVRNWNRSERQGKATKPAYESNTDLDSLLAGGFFQ